MHDGILTHLWTGSGLWYRTSARRSCPDWSSLSPATLSSLQEGSKSSVLPSSLLPVETPPINCPMPIHGNDQHVNATHTIGQFQYNTPIHGSAITVYYYQYMVVSIQYILQSCIVNTWQCHYYAGVTISCSFNHLCLADYDTFEQFRRALLTAINEGNEGFLLE